MLIWPVPGVSGDEFNHQLRVVADGAFNVSGQGGYPADIVAGYLRWVPEAHRLLRGVARDQDIRRLILTDRYWATLRGGADPTLVAGAVMDEMIFLSGQLEATAQAVSRELRRWQGDAPLPRETAYVIADTNIFLHHHVAFHEIDWHDLLSTVRTMSVVRLVIPLLVVEELDRNKDSSRKDQTRTRARQALKHIYESFSHDVESRHLLRPAEEMRGEVTMQLLLDPPHHVRLGSADEELVEQASMLQSFIGSPVDFVTYDTAAAFRASAAGLRQHRLTHSH